MSASNNSFPCLGHKLWQSNEILQGTSPGRPTLIFFEIHVRYNIMQQQQQQQQQLQQLDDNYVMVDFSKLGFGACLDNMSGCYPYIYKSLSDLNVPQHYQEEILVPAMANFAEQMKNDPRNANQKCLAMFVIVDILTTVEQNDYQAAAISPIILRRRNSSRLPNWRRLPATPNLEKVRLVEYENLSITDRCAICLDKPCPGDEIARLACSHAYHWRCIVHWLYRSNLCPVCRQPHRIFTDYTVTVEIVQNLQQKRS